jgi:hypothetical protein
LAVEWRSTGVSLQRLGWVSVGGDSEQKEVGFRSSARSGREGRERQEQNRVKDGGRREMGEL